MGVILLFFHQPQPFPKKKPRCDSQHDPLKTPEGRGIHQPDQKNAGMQRISHSGSFIRKPPRTQPPVVVDDLPRNKSNKLQQVEIWPVPTDSAKQKSL